MLDQKDLQAIAEIMDCRISKTEGMIKETNQRVLDVESGIANLNNRMDNVESGIASLNNRVDNVESGIASLADRITDVEVGLTNKITEVERFLAMELVRTEDVLNRKIEKVDNKLAEIDRYYRVEKLEDGNMGMILQILEEYQKRLKNLEMKIA